MTSNIVDKLLFLFPELRERASVEDEDLPYVMMAYLIDNLEEQARAGLPDATLTRILEFNSWCLAQPRGENSGTDVYTILVVGFYEKIIRSDLLYRLMVKLNSREQFVSAKEYLLKWVDESHYSRALELYSKICSMAAPPLLSGCLGSLGGVVG
jgi:hypothetical protein